MNIKMLLVRTTGTAIFTVFVFPLKPVQIHSMKACSTNNQRSKVYWVDSGGQKKFAAHQQHPGQQSGGRRRSGTCRPRCWRPPCRRCRWSSSMHYQKTGNYWRPKTVKKGWKTVRSSIPDGSPSGTRRQEPNVRKGPFLLTVGRQECFPDGNSWRQAISRKVNGFLTV